MTTILIVDDYPVDRQFVGAIVESKTGMNAIYARNGVEALAALERERPDLVCTDLLMPEMDGLELVEAIRSHHPLVPVILMTAYGSEDIAFRALQMGAASYVPKKCLARDLAKTINQVLAVAQADHRQHQLLECLIELESIFLLENDPSLIPALVAHFQMYLTQRKMRDQSTRMQVSIALAEAITNGLYHGNLEVSSDLRQENDKHFYALADARRMLPPYRDRRLHITAKLSSSETIYVIRDEGPGFTLSELPDPTDPQNLMKASGRGLLLIRNFMDEVFHNETGNQITMIKRHPPTTQDPSTDGSRPSSSA